MRIIREKTAAVCVDYQERILPAMTDPETLLQNTVKLLKGLRVLGVPVYLTQQYTKGLGDTVAPIREAAGTSEHLEKLTFSAYPQLREKLSRGAKKVYQSQFTGEIFAKKVEQVYLETLKGVSHGTKRA